MKYIFDFDDVLFKNTELFKEYTYKCLEEVGVKREDAKRNYQEVRASFALKSFIKSMFALYNVNQDPDVIYEKIMSKCPEFLNEEMIQAIKRVGVENCYIVTAGNEEFQKEKLQRSGIWDLFSGNRRIKIVKKDKREAILEILSLPENLNQIFSFFDDKIEFIKEIKKAGLHNIEAILYSTGDLGRILASMKGYTSEMKRK